MAAPSQQRTAAWLGLWQPASPLPLPSLGGSSSRVRLNDLRHQLAQTSGRGHPAEAGQFPSLAAALRKDVPLVRP